MRVWVGVMGALALASGAHAATMYTVNVTGTITSQMSCAPDGLNTCVDPTFAVGDKLHFTARFSDYYVVDLGGGYSQAGLYGLPTTGAEYWSVTSQGLQWSSLDEINDGTSPFYVNYNDLPIKSLADPSVIFNSQGLLGLTGYMVPVNSLNVPILDMTGLFIRPGEALYNNDAQSPGFAGTWDFADATLTVTSVPEPTTWALMLVGFGALGAAMRGTRRKPAATAA